MLLFMISVLNNSSVPVFHEMSYKFPVFFKQITAPEFTLHDCFKTVSAGRTVFLNLCIDKDVKKMSKEIWWMYGVFPVKQITSRITFTCMEGTKIWCYFRFQSINIPEMTYWLYLCFFFVVFLSSGLVIDWECFVWSDCR